MISRFAAPFNAQTRVTTDWGIKAPWLVYIGQETKPMHGSRELTGEGRLEPKWAD
jgi:hypothetical protein